MSPILLSTCLFSYAHGSFSCACGFSFYAIGVFFILICPLLMLPPLLLLLHGAGGTGGRGTLLQGPTFFGAILHAELEFFMLRLSFSSAPWGAFHPSPCLSLHLHVSHPVVHMFVFLCPRVFLLCVRFLLLCHRCLVYPNLSFAYAAPSSSSAPRRRWDGGEGHPCTRPDLFWCYPLCGAGIFLCCACPFLLLHGALSIHLHVSPSISMSPILLSTCLFSYAHGSFSCACGFSFYAIGVFFILVCPFLMLPPLLLMLHGAGGTGGRGTLLQGPTFFGAILYAELEFFYAAPVLFFCSMGRFPSISMSLPPSPCLPSCCRRVVFGLRTLPFLMLLLSFLCSMGQGMGRGRAWRSLAGPGLV